MAFIQESHDERSDLQSKIKIICRPVQSGKTFICIEDIKGHLDMTGGRSLQVVFTMNTIAANSQFSSRVIGQIKNDYGENSIMIFNSKKTGPSCEGSVHTSDFLDVIDSIRGGTTKVLIMCCHKTRVVGEKQSLHHILHAMASWRDECQVPIVVHIDEMHKYISDTFRLAYEQFHKSDFVQKICGYSATIKRLFMDRSLWRNFSIVDQTAMYVERDHYNGVKETLHRPYLSSQKQDKYLVEEPNEDLVEKALSQHLKQKTWYVRGPFNLGEEVAHLQMVNHLVSGKIIPMSNDKFHFAFIPGSTRKLTHWKIEDIVRQNYPDAAVLIVNGDGNKLVCPDNIIIDLVLNNDEELKDVLAKTFADKPSLMEHPFVITGFISVGMSMTLVHPYYGNFHSIALSHQWIGDDEMYQLRRDCNSTRGWSEDELKNVRETIEYSPPQTRQRCIDYEQTAFDISEQSGTITPLDVGISKLRKDPTKKRRYRQYGDVECKQFSTFEEAKRFAKKTLGRSFYRRSKKEGAFFTNVLRANIKERTVMSLEYVLNNKGWSLSAKQSNPASRLHVCYKDITDPTTVVWCVCYRDLK